MENNPFIFGECANEVRDKVQPDGANGVSRSVKLPDGWQETTLGDVLNFRRGHDLPRTKMIAGEHPVVGSNGIIGSHNEYTTDSPCVTIGRSGNVGNPNIVYQKCWAHNTSLYIDDFKGNDPRFIYYFLKTLDLKQFRGGSAVPTLNRNHIHPITVRYPKKLEEQKAIAHILGSLDDKIELNRRMNETLEAMAQALFQSWFVDFDPVIDNALAAGNAIPEELKERAETRAAFGDARKPLPEEIQNLFPSEFERASPSGRGWGEGANGLGWIPKGWKVSTVGEEFNVTMGQSPPGSTYNETGEGIPFFQGRADFGFRYPSERVYCTQPKRFADQDDTLVSVRAPVGDVNMAFDKCCIGRGVGAVRHLSSSRSYTYYSMIHLREHFNTFEAEGTVFGSISQKDFKALKWLRSNKELIVEYENFAGQFDEKVEVCTRNIFALTNSRDTLLPQLLSGEMRIPEAEKLVENLDRKGGQNA